MFVFLNIIVESLVGDISPPRIASGTGGVKLTAWA